MSYQIRPARSEEVRSSLRTLLVRERQTAEQLDAHVDAFLNYVNSQGLRLAPHLVCLDDGRIVASCLGVLSGGRTAMIVVPPVRLFPRWKEQIVALLKELTKRAADHNLRLLQALMDTQEAGDESVFRQAGFRYLANLLYLEHNIDLAVPLPDVRDDLHWITYNAQTHATFAETIKKTYEGSLDCEALSGLRDIEDIVESHKASGIYTPETWWVASANQQPVGVMLLARVPHRDALEVVYTGVVPHARGKGIGDALIHKALHTARKTKSNTITLAVDDKNMPACDYYRRHDFRITGKRRAYIAVVGP